LKELKSAKVSCGSEYTLILSENGELMITGQLPFKVNNKD